VSIGNNDAIAEKLREMADVLEQQLADTYRVSAYRRAARVLAELDSPVADLVRNQGLKGVVELPGIGRGIGAAIVEMVEMGSWSQLDRLKGTLAPEHLFQTIPGVGPELATEIHESLGVDTLEALEIAVHAGRLEQVPGIGERRAASIRANLEDRLGHRRIKVQAHQHAPPVDVILDVDREYRKRAAAGELRKIAPKRFNPSGEAWLPVLHTKRGSWEFTALFSNTQNAHDLDKTNDWVVVYFHDDQTPEAQCTVVTETRGTLEGHRVVRGREGDSLAHYAIGKWARL
jgi:DNA polymerase (family X)